MLAGVEQTSRQVEGAAQDSVRKVRFGGLTTIVHSYSRETTISGGSNGTRHGSAALLEHILEPHFLGAPPHRHQLEDEISHVLSGRLAVWQEGEVCIAEAGETVVKPRGVMHTFWNPGDEPVRFLEVVAPGTGFENYFAQVAPLMPEGAAPDIAGLMRVAASFGLEFDMSAVPELLAAHGLRL